MIVLRTRSARGVDAAAGVAQQIHFAIIDDGFALAAKRVRVIRVHVDHAIGGVVDGGGVAVAFDADKSGAVGSVYLPLFGADVDGAAVDQVDDITAGAAADRHGIVALDVNGPFVAKAIATAEVDQGGVRVNTINHAGFRVPDPHRGVAGIRGGDGAVTVGGGNGAAVHLSDGTAGTRHVDDGVFAAFYRAAAVGKRCAFLVIKRKAAVDERFAIFRHRHIAGIDDFLGVRGSCN